MNYVKAFFTEPCCSIKFHSVQISAPPWILLLLFLVFMGSLIWLARDAGRRGKSGFWACVFAVMAGWPVSLLWWLWLRPLPRTRGVE